MAEALDRPARSFLLVAFEEFYADVERVKRAVQADPWGIGARSTEADDRAELRRVAAQTVRQRLEALLQKQAAEAGMQRGEHGAARFREAQYVMAALADEIFLGLDWEGREAWGANLLETRLFGTHLAGERVVQRVERFVAERDAAERELQVVYFLALSLGFEGCYRGSARGELERLRRALYELVFPRQPSVARGERHLFPQAYMHTLDRSDPIRLPAVRRWATAFAIVLGLYLAVSHLSWMDVTRDLRRLNASIAEISR